MAQGKLGMIATPAQGNRIPDSVPWIADNGCFARGYPGDVPFLSWLARKQSYADRCHFAVAPDVLGDARETLSRSRPFMPVIRGLGFPVAFVAQNGQENLALPLAEFDVLFIGGDTDFKLGKGAARLAAKALDAGKRVHMGRVNTKSRLHYAASIGCTSVDGTMLAFGPDVNLPILLRWLAEMENVFV